MKKITMNKINLHHIGSEYLDRCRRCGGEVVLIQEGNFSNLGSDISECPCITIEHSNSMTILKQKLSFGNNKILKERWPTTVGKKPRKSKKT